ncbi:Hsp70 family protein [Amycolatopsis taiwanensis]|uniref:Hsp70 family protein n=1 Tax=Amycolatopsis taiwanensis TaxID=342230 RepID=UPI000489DAA5|nr:Hsp70 family protein [Amycolatopsis taiwanensis]
MNVLTIDFGTSSTVAVLSAFERGPRAIEVDGSVTMSSAVFALEDGTLVVGQDAERRARLDPARFEPNPKRRIDEATLLLGTDVVQVTDTLAAVLRRVGEEAVRQLNGQWPDAVRLSHPARWGSTRQTTLRQAAIKAGFGTSTALLPEPVAAAAHYAALRSQPLAPGSALAVYDLGAGTFDCAVVGVTRDGFTVLADNGLPDLGSLDIDQALLVYVGRQVSHLDPAQWQRVLRPQSVTDRRIRRALMQDVRDAKETLSRHAHTEVPMPEPFEDVLVTRAELEALVRPNLLRSAELMAATIRDAGLTPQQLSGVYLVGGPSRMPLVASLLADKLGVMPTTQDQPETAVAFGLHEEPTAPAAPPQDEPRTMPAISPVMRPQTWHPPIQQQPQPVRPVQVPPARPARKSLKVPMLVGAGVLVLVAALVTTLVLVNGQSGDSPPLAGGTTVHQFGGGVDPASCDQVGEKDGHGFTPCLLQLAGNVPDRAGCSSGLNGMSLPSIGGAGNATIVTCTMTSTSQQLSTTMVVYYQGLPYSSLKTSVDAQLENPSEAIEGEWQGNGLSGHYRGGVGIVGDILVFGADDRNVAGMVISIDLSGEGSQTAQDVVDYFEQHVKPGT